eukprot:scaffold2466_cov120-Cylindrotheca_fusiformis.AAC.4
MSSDLGEDNTKSTRFDETADELDNYQEWTPQDVAGFLRKSGLGDYSEVFLKHKISGRLIHLLTENDLKDMGINIVGDRLRIKSLTNALGKKKRYDRRAKVWWEGTERIYFSDAQKCCCTFGGCCPEDPSTYKLTTNHLKIKTVEPRRIGCVRLPCCNDWSVNNVDLSQVVDVDVVGEPAPCFQRVCCCAHGKGYVEITTESPGALDNDDRIRLSLEKHEADKASELILANIEECQQTWPLGMATWFGPDIL